MGERLFLGHPDLERMNGERCNGPSVAIPVSDSPDQRGNFRGFGQYVRWRKASTACAARREGETSLKYRTR